MINTAHLSVESAPPIQVPFRFFLTAPLFGVLFSLLLMFQGETLLAGRWNPLLIGSLHLLNIGILMMMVSGVLFQMLPVVGGIQFPRFKPLSTLLHLSLSLGGGLFAVGMISGMTSMLSLSFWVLAMGLLPYLLLLLLILFGGRQPPIWVLQLRYAVLFLLGLVLLGLMLLLGWSSDGVALARQWTDVHAIWALGGWFTLLLMATSFQLIPMFQVTPEFPHRIKQWLVPLVAVALLIWGGGRIAGLPLDMALLVAASGLLFYGGVTLNLIRQRKRKIFDVTVRFWQIALLSLSLGALVIIVQQLRGEELPSWLGLFWIFAVLLPMLFGMILKVAPFLVFLHLQQQMIRDPEQMGNLAALPNLFQILPVQWSKMFYWLYLAVAGLAPVALYLPPLWHLLGAVLLLLFILLQWIVYHCYHVYNTRAF